MLPVEGKLAPSFFCESNCRLRFFTLLLSAIACAPTMIEEVPAPGMTAPGMTAPGMTAPGMTAPGMIASGMTGPGMTGPGMTGPGIVIVDRGR